MLFYPLCTKSSHSASNLNIPPIPMLLHQLKANFPVRSYNGQIETVYNKLKMNRLDELIRLSDEKDIQLIFLLGPRLDDAFVVLIPVYNRLPSDHRLAVADPDLYGHFYSVELSFDDGHMNMAGATQYSEVIKEKLQSVMAAPIHTASE